MTESPGMKLPADLDTIGAIFAATNRQKADAQLKARNAVFDIMNDLADEEAALDAANERALSAALRRLAVTEELLRQERAARAELQQTVERFAEFSRASLTGLEDATDRTAGRVHEIADHERHYRDLYEQPAQTKIPADDEPNEPPQAPPLVDNDPQSEPAETARPVELAAKMRLDFDIPKFLRQGPDSLKLAMPSRPPQTATALGRVMRLTHDVFTGAAANRIGQRVA